MLLGIISDVHGNKVALDVVLERLNHEHGVDEIACAGDVVGVLGWPEETAKRVSEEVDYCVYGNHDAYIREDYTHVPEHAIQKQEHRVVTSELTEEPLDWLNGLPEVVEIEDGVVMAHANPYVENKCGYPAEGYIDKRDWTNFASEYMDCQTVIMGHTHDQGHLDLGKFEGLSGKIVNPGSTGVPYHADAKYAILDTETGESWLHRAHFDGSEIRERFEQLDITRDGDRNY